MLIAVLDYLRQNRIMHVHPERPINTPQRRLVDGGLQRPHHGVHTEPSRQHGESSRERASERVEAQGQMNDQSNSGLDSEAHDQGVGQQSGYDHLPGPDEIGIAL